MSGVRPESVRGVRTEDFFGRKGGGQIIKDNHARHSAKQSQKKRTEGSSDDYEDVDEEAESMD